MHCVVSLESMTPLHLQLSKNVKRGVARINNRGPKNACGQTDVTDAPLVPVSG